MESCVCNTEGVGRGKIAEDPAVATGKIFEI
jgi:hypothetical protein